MSDQQQFPGRLVTARRHRGFSQDELAGRTGLKPAAISHFETGTRKPSFDNLRKLADALTVTSDYLLGRTSDMEGFAEADAAFRDGFKDLTAEQREAALAMVNALNLTNKKKT